MANPTPDYILDLSTAPSAAESLSAAPAPLAAAGKTAGPRAPRPFLSVHWKCCQTYSRIYRNAAKTAYIGTCPTCGKKVTATIAEGGVDSRFFTAY